MFFYISIIASLLGLGIATYTDLKERIVPNRLNFGLIGIGLVLYGIQSIYVGSFEPIMYSIIGLAFGFLFGFLLWKLGVFAGGDVKLFAALGALNPFTPALLKLDLFTSASINVFPISLFLYALIAFLPYGLIIVIIKLAKNKKYRKKLVSEMKLQVMNAIEFSIFISGAFVVATSVISSSLLLVAFLFIVGVGWGLAKQYRKYITIIVALMGAIIGLNLFLTSVVFTAIISAGLYSIVRLLFAVRPLLSMKVRTSKLEEGMIPKETFYWKGKTIEKAKEISFKLIIEYAKKNKISELFKERKEIISSMRACGLSIAEVKLVKKLAKQGKFPKEILVKDSMPFVPTILLGYIICLAIGDFFLVMLLRGLI